MPHSGPLVVELLGVEQLLPAQRQVAPFDPSFGAQLKKRTMDGRPRSNTTAARAGEARSTPPATRSKTRTGMMTLTSPSGLPALRAGIARIQSTLTSGFRKPPGDAAAPGGSDEKELPGAGRPRRVAPRERRRSRRSSAMASEGNRTPETALSPYRMEI